jgi:hypothetical protein
VTNNNNNTGTIDDTPTKFVDIDDAVQTTLKMEPSNATVVLPM